jgi:hypothetical protein
LGTRQRSKGEGHLTRINDILTNLMEAERRAGLRGEFTAFAVGSYCNLRQRGALRVVCIHRSQIRETREA